MPYDKAQGTFFIRCRIKILHQPFLSYLLILLSFLVLSPILGERFINYNLFWVIIASFNRLRLIRNSWFSKLTMTVSKEEVIKQIFFCLDIREVEF